jgi:hypothetical protein
MMRPVGDAKVYLHREPIDMRRGRNGLAALVGEAMSQDPFAPEALYVFVGRRYDTLKILGWDGNGGSNGLPFPPFDPRATGPPIEPQQAIHQRVHRRSRCARYGAARSQGAGHRGHSRHRVVVSATASVMRDA